MPPPSRAFPVADLPDFARRQRRGLHFVCAATLAWVAIGVVQALGLAPMTRNLATFVAACVLLPVAWALSVVLKVPFTDPSPLGRPGLLFSLNQVLYLPIAMWVYPTQPDKLVMVLGVIALAHLLPFSWLYQSKAYLIVSIVGTLAAFVTGLVASGLMTALVVAALLATLAVALVLEQRNPVTR